MRMLVDGVVPLASICLLSGCWLAYDFSDYADSDAKAVKTFGDTRVGASTWAGYPSWKVGSPYSLSETGSVLSITGTFDITGAPTPSRAAMYRDDAGNPGALVAGSIAADKEIPVGDGVRITYGLDSPVEIDSGTYWLVFSFDRTSPENNVKLWIAGPGTVKYNQPNQI